MTTSHQSEELLFEPEHDWVRMQFRTTRDAEPSNPLWAWLWGGMQHQLEHHLFPTMPRYRYHALRPLLRAWAEENGQSYLASPSWEILRGNWELLRRVAAAA